MPWQPGNQECQLAKGNCRIRGRSVQVDNVRLPYQLGLDCPRKGGLAYALCANHYYAVKITFPEDGNN